MLVNPVSFRMGVCIFWKGTWMTYKYHNYRYLCFSDLFFFEYIYFFFKKCMWASRYYFLSHINIHRFNNKMIINLFCYKVIQMESTSVDQNEFELYSSNFELWGRFYRYGLLTKNLNWIKVFPRNKFLSNQNKINLLKSSFHIKLKKFNKFFSNYEIIKQLIFQNKRNFKNVSLILVKFVIWKFGFNFKYIFFNIYMYLFLKILFNDLKNINVLFIKNMSINILEITFENVNSRTVAEYLKWCLVRRYNAWESFMKVLPDMKYRIASGIIGGFKILFSGRFKRAMRAIYLFRKRGIERIGEITGGVDYSRCVYKTKYGTGMIKVWLSSGTTLSFFLKNLSSINLFFLKIYKWNNVKFFLLKKNLYFLKNFLKVLPIKFGYTSKFVKGLIFHILYIYLFLNIYLKHIFIKKNIEFYIIRIFLPQYCLYSISLKHFWEGSIIKIIPYINLKLFKRLNLRSSYKSRVFLNKTIQLEYYTWNLRLKKFVK